MMDLIGSAIALILILIVLFVPITLALAFAARRGWFSFRRRPDKSSSAPTEPGNGA